MSNADRSTDGNPVLGAPLEPVPVLTDSVTVPILDGPAAKPVHAISDAEPEPELLEPEILPRSDHPWSFEQEPQLDTMDDLTIVESPDPTFADTDVHPELDSEVKGIVTAALSAQSADLSEAVEAEDEALDAQRVGVLVLTTDEQFFDAVEAAVGGRHPVHFAGNIEQAVQRVLSGHSGVLVTDAAILQYDVDKLTLKLKRSVPELVSIIAGRRKDGEKLMELVSAGQIYRFLLKPLAPGSTRLAVEAGINKHLELFRNPEQVVPAPEFEFQGLDRKKLLWIGGAVAGALVTIIALAIAFFGTEPEPQSVSQQGIDGDSSSAESQAITRDGQAGGLVGTLPGTIDRDVVLAPELVTALAGAQQAMIAAGSVDAQDESVVDLYQSATHYYQTALQIDPENGQAKQGFENAMDALFLQVESALGDKQIEKAANLLESVRAIAPEHRRLGVMEFEIDRQRESLSAEAAPPESVEVPAEAPAEEAATPTDDRLDEFVQLALLRADRGDLIAPADDSATHYLRQAQQQNAGDSRVKEAAASIRATLLANTQARIDAGDLNLASSLIEEASKLPGAVAEIDALRQSLNDVRVAVVAEANQALLKQAQDSLEAERLVEPDGNNAKHYLANLQRADRNYEGLDSAMVSLSDQILSRAELAVQDEELERANEWFDHAKSLGVNYAKVTDFETELGFAKRQAEILAIPNALKDGDIAKYYAPWYPRLAVRREQEGWVDLEFVVNLDGVPEDIKVQNADPAEIFNDNAVEAVSRWRIKPYVVDGRPMRRRAQVRVRFDLQD